MITQDPHVSGWRPDFLPAEDQLANQSDRLRSLVGEKIAGIWVVWNLESDEWFADLPVVVQLESCRQLEVCWEKFDDLSITWNTIDTTPTPRAWVEWPLGWRRNALPPFLPVVGATVREFAATRSLFTMQDFNHPREVNSTWLTTGLWIATTATGLHIVNALDENGVSSEELVRDRTRDFRLL